MTERRPLLMPEPGAKTVSMVPGAVSVAAARHTATTGGLDVTGMEPIDGETAEDFALYVDYIMQDEIIDPMKWCLIQGVDRHVAMFNRWGIRRARLLKLKRDFDAAEVDHAGKRVVMGQISLASGVTDLIADAQEQVRLAMQAGDEAASGRALDRLERLMELQGKAAELGIKFSTSLRTAGAKGATVNVTQQTAVAPDRGLSALAAQVVSGSQQDPFALQDGE